MALLLIGQNPHVPFLFHFQINRKRFCVVRATHISYVNQKVNEIKKKKNAHIFANQLATNWWLPVHWQTHDSSSTVFAVVIVTLNMHI